MDISKKVYSVMQKTVEVVNTLFKSKKTISAYMFHRVSVADYKGYRNLTISVENFERFIVNKVDQGWKFASVSMLEDADVYDGKTALITFDDMYEDAYINAVPVLNKFGIPFTVFVTAEFVGKPEYISYAQLKDLSENPLCTIGGHTISHQPLIKLSNAEKTYQTSIKEFSAITNIEPLVFAYPYGTYYACDKKTRQIVKRSGYKLAFSTLCFAFSLNQFKKDPYFVPRININNRNYRFDGNVIKGLRRNR